MIRGPVAVRRPRGALHVAVPTGRGYRAACQRDIHGTDLIVYTGRDRDRAWRLEVVCRDCARLTQRGRHALRAAMHQ